MSWPTSSKATTTHTDSPSDNPQNARAEIKQDIDNVNAIIDTFDLGTTPQQGSILAYDSATGKFSSTGTQNLAKAYFIFKGYETSIVHSGGSGLPGAADGTTSQSDAGTYPITSDGRRFQMMDRLESFDPYNITTDITGDGLQFGPGTYLIQTTSQQNFFQTNFGAFGSVEGPSWLEHRFLNVEDDGDSTDNTPQRWDNYPGFITNDISTRGHSHYEVATVAAGTTKNYYMFAFPRNPMGDFSGMDPNNPPSQQAQIVLEIIKVGG